ncbi:MAG: sulfotransferase [bacterium]
MAGLGRSGSTIFHRILGALDGFLPAGEIMHLGRALCNNEFCSCGERVRDCEVWGKVGEQFEEEFAKDKYSLDFFQHKLRNKRYFFNVCSVFFPRRPRWLREHLEGYKEQILRVYQTLQATTGCRFIVDSSKNAAYAKLLGEIPQVRLYVIHLIRDSRGVAFSFGKRKKRPGVPQRKEDDGYFDQFKPFTTALLWCSANFLAERLQKKCVQYMRVRYRDFVSTPVDTIKNVLKTMDIYTGPEQLSHLTDHTAELKNTHILSGNTVRSQHGRIKISEDVEWKIKMRLSGKILVTILTLPFLMRYGYFSRNGKTR